MKNGWCKAWKAMMNIEKERKSVLKLISMASFLNQAWISDAHLKLILGGGRHWQHTQAEFALWDGLWKFWKSVLQEFACNHIM